MDFLSWLRISGLGLCVVGGLVGAFVVPEVPVGIGLVSICGNGLVRVLLEDQRFEHEKLLREMNEKSRQLQHERDIEMLEMLHELEDFSSVKPDA
jgi:hypothetical protein